MIAIGKTKIDTNIFLAPLSGVSDLALRLISREHGCGFAFFEMIDAHSLAFGHVKKSLSLLRTTPEDTPIAAQLLANDVDMTIRAADKIIANARISLLDINAACPVRKVLRKKGGAALLTHPTQLVLIIEALVRRMPVPITVKLRVGFDRHDREEIAAIARRCEEAGAGALFVHGRTMAEGYAGDIDYASIAAVKRAVRIPVFGSGNIFSGPAAGKMLNETGCDGVLVARGALGNPWIFREITEYLTTGRTPTPPSVEEKIAVLKRQLAYMDAQKDLRPATKVGIMRKVVIWYTRGLRRSTRLRDEVCRVTRYDALLQLIDSFSDKEGQEVML